MVFHNVTRLSNGVYECISMDTDTYEEIKGKTVVFVNCKETHDHDEYNVPAVRLPGLISLLSLRVCL